MAEIFTGPRGGQYRIGAGGNKVYIGSRNTGSSVADVIQSAVEEASGLTPEELLEIGQFCTTMILTRTKQGVDADGNPFAPYSQSYTEDRAKHQLGSQPDLARTGQMLGSMMPTVTGPEEVTISFASRAEAEKATAHNYGTRRARGALNRGFLGRTVGRVAKNVSVLSTTGIPRREFFDVRQEKEKEAIKEIIGRDVIARIEKVVK